MDAQKDEAAVLALATQLDKADMVTMDDSNSIDTQSYLNSTAAPIPNVLRHSDHTCNSRTKPASIVTASSSTSVEGEEVIKSTLPSEIMIAVFDYLSIQNLIICQRVSRRFRVIARTVMLDKLGGQSMSCQRQQCLQCRRTQQQPLWQRSSGGLSAVGGGSQHGSSGLPPLPYHHLINNPNTLLPTTVSPVSHNSSYFQPQDPPLQLHQLHHHLYQHQSTEDMSQHHQTDLHIHHQSHSYHVQPRHSQPSQQQPLDSSLHHAHGPASQYHHTANYVAPGSIALFLFPYHDHTPTSWQDRQSVHFVCTGIDRLKEQLLFSPIYPEIGDCLKFNTNSWNLPSTFAAPGPFGGDGFATPFKTPSSTLSGGQDATRIHNNNVNISDPRSNNRFAAITTTAAETSYSTGLDLFDYATGRPRFPGSGQANTDSLNSTSYSFANQFNRPHSRSPSLASISSSSSSPSSSSSFSSTPPSPPRQPLSPLSSSITAAIPPTPSWANVNGHGGEHYSVIGIKHGDWPEDRQAAGRWWGGGLHWSMSQESMVYMPWMGASSAFDFHQGSSSSSNGGTLNNNSTQDANMENVSPTSNTNGNNVEGGYTKVHKHHMYLSSMRLHNPPADHHRFLCLHHDQLMTDIAAATSSSSSLSSTDPKSNHLARASKMPLTTAGSSHLEVDYGARVTESKRCLFCLSTPCKANLEIQVKFDQLRVSLDWILSGFGPDQKPTAATARDSSGGGPTIADALAMGSARQGQVPF
ncbi:hypothetical protein BG015_009581 [Linnemannia schmuckeri]|uniref:F-box domain-containing protein n=1 Tax=Linnemannia schmuckeri TaxID=64567 RepID=A0A9P5V9H7_9FUNG|nr:hypothetical protein BG015_009581 [Linnemannia schmuckeri]